MNDRAADSDAWQVSPERYVERCPPRFGPSFDRTSCYVAVRDGTRIALDVYLPDGRGQDLRLPAIVVFTPYYRRFALTEGAPDTVEAAPSAAPYRDAFVAHGYALVVVDTRGAGASFGTRDGFRSPIERDDYHDVVDWLIRQPWSNGRVGSIGVSYVGAAACFLAGTGHPAVRAVAPLFAVWDTYRDHHYPGGLHLNKLAAVYQELMEALDQDRRDLLQRFAYFTNPHFAGPAPVDEDGGALLEAAIAEHSANFELPDFIRQLAFTDSGLSYDPDYTIGAVSPYTYARTIREDVAYLCVSGWMDGGGFTNGAINRFLSLPVRHKHLLIGPWDHGARTNVSPFRNDQTPQFPLLAECLRFFDHYLKEEPTGLEAEAPVHYFTLGEERWHAADSWPPAAAPWMLYLGPEQALTTTPPDLPDADAYRADYGCGTGAHTRYERLAAFAVETYYDDWHGRDARMLVYSSPPLEDALHLTGHPVVTLHLAADQRDTGLFVYLEDVGSDGNCRYVTEGVFRAIHRKVVPAPRYLQWLGPYHSYARTDAMLLEPEVPAEIAFSLLPTSWRFAAGHRIRIAIAAADRDHFARIPDGRPPQLTFFHGAAKPSRIELPLAG